MSTDVKLSKAQISKIIQSGGSFGSSLGNLGKKALNDIIKIIESLEDSGVLIDGITGKVKHEKKNKNADFLEIC